MKPIYRALPPILSVALVLSACAQPTPETSPQSGSEKETIPVSTSSDHPSSSGEHKHTNRLINETSPYLLQHAHNPVDWYPWGEEAFAKAKEEDKPIFLSVGYSSCHWCHVMEHESFEKEDVAEIMNAHYVSIKVDREERPDVDEIYMTAVQAMTGSGGWPMSVWLTPDLKPFYGGTYFPPEARYGKPGFKTVLARLAEAWDQQRAELVSDSNKLLKHMEQNLASDTSGRGEISSSLINLAVRDLRKNFDGIDGGFGGAPKFPSSPTIALLLRDYARDKDHRTLNMAVLTLDKMAAGGMYDHLGGGFARYSTDDKWLLPHFEKMLYDNGQLAQVYLEAYQLTGYDRYRHVAEETFDYILRDMRDERGGFHSAEDADSEGEEGKFYIWEHAEIVSILGPEDAAYFSTYYSLKPEGNFLSQEHYHAGKNILHLNTTIEDFATKQGQTVDEVREKLDVMKAKLLEVRSQRVRPGLDDKVLTSWNALMISAFAQGYRVLDDARYQDAAVEAATFIMTDMMTDTDLLRTHRHGESRLPAYLDDYAFMVLALMDVYEATFDDKWLTEADRLTNMMIEKFWDEEAQSFYFTSDDHKNLIIRTRPTYDGAVPSGNSMAALALLRLAKFIDSPDYYDKGESILAGNADTMRRAPRAFIKMLGAVDFYAYPPKEIAIAGKAGKDDTQALLDAVFQNFVPNKVVAFVDPESDDAEALGGRLPLLAQKTMIGGKAAAYVCKDYACKLPVTKAADLLEQLGLERGDD